MSPTFNLSVTMITESGSMKTFSVPHHALPPDTVAFLVREANRTTPPLPVPTSYYDPGSSPIAFRGGVSE